jgi:hypothetical protein
MEKLSQAMKVLAKIKKKCAMSLPHPSGRCRKAFFSPSFFVFFFAS